MSASEEDRTRLEQEAVTDVPCGLRLTWVRSPEVCR